MPSTDSDELGKVVDMPLERVVGMARNEWTASIGIDGRHGPEHAICEPTVSVSSIQIKAFRSNLPHTASASILDRQTRHKYDCRK